MKADQATETAIKGALQRMADCYTRRDLEGLIATLTPDPDTFMYGTAPDEKRVGLAEIRQQAQRDWSQTEAAALEIGATLVSSRGDVAWVATDTTFRVKLGGQEIALPGRFTGVYEKRGDRWLLAQSHFSLPAVLLVDTCHFLLPPSR
jgi:ketosteroid isomerase-like protein